MQTHELILGILGVWRITNLLSNEAGPGAVLTKLRNWAGTGFVGQLLECFYCTSLWVAMPFAVLIGHGWKECGLIWPALSGAAILIERFSAGWPAAPRGFYVEDTEVENVLR